MIYLNKIIKFYKEAHKMRHFPRITEVIITKKKIFPYYGFLGDGNFGDELVFEATKQLFKGHILVPIKRRMPILLRIFCFLNKSRFSGVVIGGGTLIGPFWQRNFYERLVLLNKAFYLHGTGVNEKIENEKNWTNLLKGKVYGGVRGPLSIKHLSHMIKTLNVVGDAAFSFFNGSDWDDKVGNKRIILINLGTHFDYEGQNSSRFEVEKFIDYLFENKFKVKFLPFHEKDLKIGKNLIARRPEISLLEQPKNYLEAVKVFQNCSFVIGERLHFIVMAVLTKSPFISINYSKKHEDLLASVNIPHAGLRPFDVNLNSIISAFEGKSKIDWDLIKIKIEQLNDIQNEEYKKFLNSLN